MFENEIISTGELFEKYLYTLRISQKVLCKGICSEANLSYIKKGSQKLTEELAIKFAARFNEIAKANDIMINEITKDYLYASIDDRANMVFRNKLKELKEINEIDRIDEFEKRVNELEHLIKTYNIETINKINLYICTSDFYYFNYNYSKSEDMCNKGLKYTTLKYKLQKAMLYVSKARIKTELGFSEDALIEIENAQMLNNDINDNALNIRILYRKAKIYKDLGKLDNTIKYLEELVKLDLNEKKELEIKIMYANCLIDNGEYIKAQNNYIHALELSMNINNKDYIALCYRNIAEINFKQEDYKLALKNMFESLNNNPGNGYIIENLYFTAIILKKLKLNAEEYLVKALDVVDKLDVKNKILIEKIIYELIIIYIENEDDNNIDNLMDKLIPLDLDHSLICPMVVEYYRYRNEKKSVEYNIKQFDYIKKMKKI